MDYFYRRLPSKMSTKDAAQCIMAVSVNGAHKSVLEPCFTASNIDKATSQLVNYISEQGFNSSDILAGCNNQTGTSNQATDCTSYEFLCNISPTICGITRFPACANPPKCPSPNNGGGTANNKHKSSALTIALIIFSCCLFLGLIIYFIKRDKY